METWQKKSPLYLPSFKQRIRLFLNQFLLPIFLVVFGTVVMICGVAYPIYELSNKDESDESASGH